MSVITPPMLLSFVLALPLANAAEPQPQPETESPATASPAEVGDADTAATSGSLPGQRADDGDAGHQAERLATIDEVEVTMLDLYSFARRNPLSLRRFGTNEGRTQVLSLLIGDILINLAAIERAGLTGSVSAADLSAAVKSLEAAEFTPDPPSDDVLAEYYQAHREEFGIPAAVRIRDIFFPVPEGADEETRAEVRQRAEAVLTQVREEGASFEALAADLAHNDVARLLAGDQGYRPLFQFPGLAAVTADMKVGELSDVIDLGDGYQVFQLLGRRDGIIAPFSEVKQDVRARFLQEETRRRRMAFLRAYGEEVGITIHAERYNRAWPPGDTPAASAAN